MTALLPLIRPAALVLCLGIAACAAPATQQAATPAATTAALPSADMTAAKALLSPDETLQALEFDMKGARTVQGRIAGYKSTAYAVPVAAGQTLKVTFASSINAAGFNVYDTAKPQEAVFRGSVDGRSASLSAASATTYVIRPFQERSVARRGTTANYTLTVTRQ